MLSKKKLIGIVSLMVLAIASAGGAYAIGAFGDNPRVPTTYYKGHSHDDAGTHGAPQHSGGTDSYGCHNASVPYHCH